MEIKPVRSDLYNMVRRQKFFETDTKTDKYEFFRDFEDEEFDLDTLSEYMIELKRTYPAQDSASVLMEAQIPYDYLIQVMDIVRSVEVPIEKPEGEEFVEGEPQFELVALFSDVSVGDAP